MSSITQIRKSTNISPKKSKLVASLVIIVYHLQSNLSHSYERPGARCDVIEWYKEIGTNIHTLPLRIEMR
jgi:hypothetical protein